MGFLKKEKKNCFNCAFLCRMSDTSSCLTKEERDILKNNSSGFNYALGCYLGEFKEAISTSEEKIYIRNKILNNQSVCNDNNKFYSFAKKGLKQLEACKKERDEKLKSKISIKNNIVIPALVGFIIGIGVYQYQKWDEQKVKPKNIVEQQVGWA